MKLVKTANNTISYLDRGSGAPVVLVHSSGLGASQWDRMIDAIGPGYRVLAPDLSGYGKSSVARPGTNALRQDAEIVGSILKLAGKGAHLVGHSYGGAVAVLAARSVHGLASITLIEPVVADLLRTSNSTEAVAELEALTDGFLGALDAADPRRGLKAFVDYWNAEGAWDQLSPEAHAGLVASAEKISMEVRGVAFSDIGSFALDTIEPPVLVLTGMETRKAPKRMSELITRALPSASHQFISGAGHMAPLTHPAEVAQAIVAHISGNGDPLHL